jgi:uncharacterized ion transporter superfamily protein YfcC
VKPIKDIKLPHTLALIFAIIVVMGVLTWIIPAGQFDRVEKSGRTVVVPNTYQRVAAQPQGLGAVLGAPLAGFVEAANIIAFIFIIGGAFGVVISTGAVDAAIKAFTRFVERTPPLRTATIPLLTTLFSLAGATFGMSEEVLAFILIFIPLARSLGYDSIVGVAIPFVGAGAGFAAAFTNPFTLGIAQGIAELPLFSGLEYRVMVWAIVTTIAVVFIVRYAERVKHRPQLSPVYDLDRERKTEVTHPTNPVQAATFSRPQKLVMLIFLLAFAGLVMGALKFDWYITEIAALFLGMGILAGIVARLRLNQIAETFVAGAKDMMTAALVVAFSRGILVIATEGKIIDTILASLSGLTAQAHPIISAYLMLFVQAGINFFVPSGSGQAALTMPIMAPLSDLLGITRQTAVLIFQFGDGFNNMIIPTSGVTMGVLGIAGIPFERWLRWALPLALIFYAAGLILIAIPVLFGWGPH